MWYIESIHKKIKRGPGYQVRIKKPPLNKLFHVTMLFSPFLAVAVAALGNSSRSFVASVLYPISTKMSSATRCLSSSLRAAISAHSSSSLACARTLTPGTALAFIYYVSLSLTSYLQELERMVRLLFSESLHGHQGILDRGGRARRE